jgi:hypothetical protein
MAIATEFLPGRYHHNSHSGSRRDNMSGCIGYFGASQSTSPQSNSNLYLYGSNLTLHLLYNAESIQRLPFRHTVYIYTFYANCCEDEIQLSAQNFIGAMVSYMPRPSPILQGHIP